MSDYPMLISNKLHSFRNFKTANVQFLCDIKAVMSKINVFHILDIYIHNP